MLHALDDFKARCVTAIHRLSCRLFWKAIR
jgi:hypothetical protein